MAASTRAPAAAERRPAPLAARPPALLAAALAVVATYAAFASGATRYPEETRLQVLLAAIALGAVGSWAVGSGVRWRPSRPAAIGLGLLAALAGWSALSLLWSITPERSWLEANRAMAYTLAVGLAVALGASHPRALERTTLLLLGSAVLVALYALATKTLPGLSLGGGLLDLDQGAGLSRLRAPLGYWNATALVCALAVPTALRVACDRTRRERERTAAVAAALLLLVVMGLTYSRGGVLALGTALVVMTALGGARLRGLVVLAGVALASTPVLGVAFTRVGTSGNGAALAVRESDGRLLLLVFVVCLALLVAVATAAWRVEPRVRWTPERTRTLFRLGAILASFALLLGVTGVALSERGLPGTVADRVQSFTEPSRDDAYAPGRLVTTTSGNRWTWWREAVGAWSDKPVAGWGAGSFRATHLRYRRDEQAVTQAHSVPLQFLAETGLVGLLLALGAFGALGLAAVRRVRALPGGRERDLAVAALGACAGWAVHGLYDWDWNIPGATLPALLLLGVLAGGSGLRASDAAGHRRGPGVDRRLALPGVPQRLPSRPASPALAVAAAALVSSLVAASAILPAWADGKASDAQVAIEAGSDEAALREAAAEADLAARLDPVALRPLLASSAIARRRGRLLDARAFLLRAVTRQPDSADAWLALAGAAFELADRPGFERAALRALALDPRSPRTRAVALAAVAYRTPIGASGTAGGTPLAPAPVQAPALPAAPPPAPAAPPVGATGATGTTVPAGSQDALDARGG